MVIALVGARAEEIEGSAAASERAASGKLPSALPVRRDVPEPGSPPPWTSTLGLLSLGAALGGWWIWTRRASRSRLARNVNPIVRLGSQALTQQASVHAVQWNGEEFLLGCTAQGVVLLSRRSVPASPGEES